VQIEGGRRNEELEKERRAAELAREQAEALKMEVLNEKERAKANADEARAALIEVEKLREEISRVKADEEEAICACKAAQDKLQDALLELATLKLGTAPAQNDSSSPANMLEHVKQKLLDAEEEIAKSKQALVMSEEASSLSLKRLQGEIESLKSEKEANDRSLVEAHQLLAETNKAKLNLEGEIRRLLDSRMQWEMEKDAIDIDVVQVPVSEECREEKPQADCTEEVVEITTIYPSSNGDHIDDRDMVNDLSPSGAMGEEVENKDEERVFLRRQDFASSSLKEEVGERDHDGHARDEMVSSSQEDLASPNPSLPIKKKKKTLFLRLGTLLEKKKHSQTP
jgi:chromosome segregation ATPase